MSGDLVSLKILLVFGSSSDRELMRRGALGVSVPIDVLEADSSAAANARLAGNELDIVFVDAAIDRAERAAVVTAMRAARPQPFVLFVAAHANEAEAVAAGADGAIAKPPNVKDATSLIERCIRSRLTHRVLLVDDSKTMRSVVRKILTASRFLLDISEAHEGIDALKQITTDKFDLVFLDYNMPGLNGIETLAEINRQNPKLAVVIMTSTADDVLAEKARKAGAAAFLKKPFYPADIDAILQRLFGIRGGG